MKCHVLRSNRYFGLALKVIRNLRQNGLRITLAKIKNKLHYAKKFKHLHKRVPYTEADLDAQRKEVFPKTVRISILVPLRALMIVILLF